MASNKVSDRRGFVRVGVTVNCDKALGRTKQSFAEMVDINNIMKRYRTTGMIDHLSGRQPFYGDVSQFKDYQSSLEVVRKADELFNNMSSDIRSKFKNDPMEMIAFLDDPKNLDEAIKLGMVVKRPDPDAPPAPPAVPDGGGTGTPPK